MADGVIECEGSELSNAPIKLILIGAPRTTYCRAHVMCNNFELRQRIVTEPSNSTFICGSSHGVVFRCRWSRHVQEREMRRIECTFHKHAILNFE